jgi:Putative beta-barrel porin-2, OmpL-like. bbp2
MGNVLYGFRGDHYALSRRRRRRRFNGAATGFTQEWAIVNYINWQITAKDSISLRNEFMNDVNGQRTGTATRYYGIGLGLAHFFKQNVFVRPETVYYQAMDNPAFEQGTKFTQFVAAFDLIVRF